MIYTVTLNPALDKTVEIPNLALDTVNRITKMRTDPGGKGINVSKVIAKLGGTSKAIGILAGNSGRAIQEALDAEGLAHHFRFVPGETRTNLKVIDPENHTNTDINEPGIEVDAPELTALLYDLLKELKRGDIVVLAGSLRRVPPRTPTTHGGILQKSRRKGLSGRGRRAAGRGPESSALSGQAQQRRAFPHDGPGAENAG